MKKVTIALAAALLGASPIVLSSAPQAQVSEIDANFAWTSIMSAGDRAPLVARVRNVPSVGVIRLDFFRAPRQDSIPDYGSFKMLARKYSGGIARLQAAMRGNPAVRNALEERGIPISRVVGVQVGSNGALRLYLL